MVINLPEGFPLFHTMRLTEAKLEYGVAVTDRKKGRKKGRDTLIEGSSSLGEISPFIAVMAIIFIFSL